MRVLLGVSTESVFFLWANIELRVLAFLSLWSIKVVQPKRGRLIKVFLIQRLAGLGMLLALMLSELSLGEDLIIAAFRILSLIKLGGFPFQNWTIEIVDTIPIELLFIFLTLQKVLPIHLLSFFTPRLLFTCAVTSWVFLTLRCLTLVSLKKIVLISSTNFIIALIGLFPFIRLQWKPVFLMYTFSLIPLFVILTPGPRSEGGRGKPTVRSRLGWVLVLGTLAGVPPLPGFFIKLEVLLVLLRHIEWVVGLIFLLRGVLLVRMYMSILIKSLHEAAWGALGPLPTRRVLTLLVGGVLFLLTVWL